MGSNCTLLELKQKFKSKIQVRTEFELHLTGIETPEQPENVVALVKFELHLTGIETTMPLIQLFRLFCSNCTLLELKPKKTSIIAETLEFELHLTGIETSSIYFVQSLVAVRIAPYWN